MTDTTNIVGGVDSFTLDGRELGVAGDAKYRTSGNTNTTELGSTGVDGFSTTPSIPFIEVALRNRGSLSIEEITNIKNSTGVMGLSNGKRVISRNGWRVGDPPEVDAATGKFTLRIDALDVREV